MNLYTVSFNPLFNTLNPVVYMSDIDLDDIYEKIKSYVAQFNSTKELLEGSVRSLESAEALGTSHSEYKRYESDVNNYGIQLADWREKLVSIRNSLNERYDYLTKLNQFLISIQERYKNIISSILPDIDAQLDFATKAIESARDNFSKSYEGSQKNIHSDHLASCYNNITDANTNLSGLNGMIQDRTIVIHDYITQASSYLSKIDKCISYIPADV